MGKRPTRNSTENGEVSEDIFSKFDFDFNPFFDSISDQERIEYKRLLNNLKNLEESKSNLNRMHRMELLDYKARKTDDPFLEEPALSQEILGKIEEIHFC